MTEYFSSNEKYEGILIKEAYKNITNVSYPMITIEEILNEENVKYSTSEGEEISNLGYQFVIHAQSTSTMDKVDIITEIASLIDSFMKTDTYKACKRLGSLVKKPMLEDTSIMLGYLRYDCQLNIITNTIYRRL